MTEVRESAGDGRHDEVPDPRRSGIFDPVILRYAVLIYLVVLPIGHLVTLRVNHAVATVTDVFMGLVILAGLVDLLRALPHYLARRGEVFRPLPALRSFHMAALLLLSFSAWVALSGAWGYHPSYALAKGAAYAGLALGALAIVWSGAGWGRAADAWLFGTLICLILTWALVFVPGPLRESVVYRSGSIRGLPLPQLAGPFLHPNMFGDYLVVSGALLWARWIPTHERMGAWAIAGAALLGATLVLTASSAWLGAGVLLAVIGLLTMRRRQGRISISARRPGPVLLIVAGLVITTVTFAGLVMPMGYSVGGISVTASGIRPSIWASAWRAVVDSPIGGVGASPFLAQAADPLSSSGDLWLWDAHNLYLSLLGQFGIVGLALIGGAVAILVRALVREGAARRHAALLLALFTVAVHGVTVASEDFRHVWALIGLIGLAGVPEWAQGRWWKAEADRLAGPRPSAALGESGVPTA